MCNHKDLKPAIYAYVSPRWSDLVKRKKCIFCKTRSSPNIFFYLISFNSFNSIQMWSIEKYSVQWEAENSGKGRWPSDSSYIFRYSNEHEA